MKVIEVIEKEIAVELTTGDLPGRAATVAVGSVAELPAGSEPTVENSGTDSDAVLDFGIPAGKAASVRVGSVRTLPAGSEASVRNSGTQTDAVLDFELPGGEPGRAGTVRVGRVTTLPAGSAASVENTGTAENAVLDFGIPKGADGLDSPSLWGRIMGTLADQTDLAAVLGLKADKSSVYPKTVTELLLSEKGDVITETVSGRVIELSDAAEAPVSALAVDVEPVRDLNGYDRPWGPGEGKNLWNPENVLKAYVHGTNNTINGGNNYRTIFLAVTPGVTYTFSKLSGSKLRYGFTENHPEIGTVVSNVVHIDGELQASFTVPSDKYYAVIYVAGSGENSAGILSECQVEAGPEATPYAPYANICPISGLTGLSIRHSGADPSDFETLEISWQTEAGTVFGGIFNVMTGELTVTDGSISSYQGETLSGAWISDRDIYAEGAVPTAGAQVVYKLAEPVIYHLEPHEFSTFYGTNNLRSGSGGLVLTYKADTKLYVDKKLEKLWTRMETLLSESR